MGGGSGGGSGGGESGGVGVGGGEWGGSGGGQTMEVLWGTGIGQFFFSIRNSIVLIKCTLYDTVFQR